MLTGRGPRLALLLTFFLSGAAALVYQVLWTRLLGLVFGVTIQAAGTVLACFMGGLALGSYVGGRLADRSPRPLAMFAIVEVLIAIAGLATPLAMRGVEWSYLAMHPALADAPVIAGLARAALVVAVLIVPSALMGMTFPLVLRSALGRMSEFGATASLLYGVNTTGAIAGTLVGGLWLVPNIGVSASFRVAAATNLAVAALAFLIARRAVRAIIPAPTGADAIATAQTSDAPRGIAADAIDPRIGPPVLIALAVSGFVSLAMEILWFRVLVFFLRPTTYAFAAMLSAVLAGLAVGSLIITPLFRRRWQWPLIFAGLQIAAAIGSLFSFRVIAHSYGILTWDGWASLPEPLPYLVSILAVAFVAIFPVAVLLGAAFPVGLQLWARSGRDQLLGVGRRIGSVYAVNVLGAIVGSLGASFLLIPGLGTERSLLLVTGLSMAAGLLVLTRAHGSRRAAATVALGGLVAFGGAALATPDIFRSVIGQRYPDDTLLWHEEGAQATVTVTQRNQERTLLIDGAHHASDGHGMVYIHRLIGTLGVALHPDPKRVLVIGLGGGVTSSGASTLETSTTDIVELSAPVVGGARWFSQVNGNLLDRPNVRIAINDGRNHLLLGGHRYDLVTADLILPTFAGSANLYSADYFRLVRRNLSENGLVVQWAAHDSQDEYKMMVRTFMSVMPYTTLWSGGLLVGSLQPLKISRADFEAKLASPSARAAFEAVKMATFDDVLRHFVAGHSELRRYTGRGPILTDDRPVIEYFLSLPKGERVDLSSLQRNVNEILADRQ